MLRRTLLQGLPLAALTLPLASRLVLAQDAAGYPDQPGDDHRAVRGGRQHGRLRAPGRRGAGQALGPAFFVDNKAGAGGNLGVGQLARAEPDGYTLGMGTVSTHAINPTLYKNCPTIRIRRSPRSRCS